MAFNSLLRRAVVTCSMIPMSTRRSVVVGVEFLPFLRFSSTATKGNDNDKNIASLIEYSVPAPNMKKVPDRSDFEVQKVVRYGLYVLYDLCLNKKSKDESIIVHMKLPRSWNGGDPVSEMAVYIVRRNLHLYFNLLANPNQFKIYDIGMRNDGGKHLECFEDFVKSKGVNSSMINMLFDHFGIKTKEKITQLMAN